MHPIPVTFAPPLQMGLIQTNRNRSAPSSNMASMYDSDFLFLKTKTVVSPSSRPCVHVLMSWTILCRTELQPSSRMVCMPGIHLRNCESFVDVKTMQSTILISRVDYSPAPSYARLSSYVPALTPPHSAHHQATLSVVSSQRRTHWYMVSVMVISYSRTI